MEKIPPSLCVIEALKLCLECINSIFNNYNFQQKDGTGQGPDMSCSYGDIAIVQFDLKVQNYFLKPTVWKCIPDSVLMISL